MTDAQHRRCDIYIVNLYLFEFLHTSDFVLCSDVMTWRCDFMMCDRSVVITHSGPEGTAADKVMIECLCFVSVYCVCACVCIGLHIYLQVCMNVCIRLLHTLWIHLA